MVRLIAAGYNCEFRGLIRQDEQASLFMAFCLINGTRAANLSFLSIAILSKYCAFYISRACNLPPLLHTRDVTDTVSLSIIPYIIIHLIIGSSLI